ncbi:RmlC-like cupin domain-containing protein [Fusarium redolens]|uniref:homogentisate 1,2-dioxygenase n=1 Tax=Fusarium redolens TaxID=48865 RepID=A0A9P9FXZ1_FUSRE|nr:RmlC-like cupin domain-containing protein [Fusarium redolens]KAH7210795.1 RmlC-like cupin domain-containing protein [Fusarium redolens]
MPDNQAFGTSDGDLCLVPQKGSIDIKTEIGPIRLRPGEIAVIPYAVRFYIAVVKGPICRYIVETFINHFKLPELEIINSSGLKYCSKLFSTIIKENIFNIVGLHGTFFLFKYDLGAISYDHAFITSIKGSLDSMNNGSGICTLYNGMTPHGPLQSEWETGISEKQVPLRISNDNMLVMFESSYAPGVADWATGGKRVPIGDRYNEFEPTQL